MKNLYSNGTKPHQVKLVALYHSLRTHIEHLSANSNHETLRATLAYVALSLLAFLAAIAQFTHLSSHYL